MTKKPYSEKVGKEIDKMAADASPTKHIKEIMPAVVAQIGGAGYELPDDAVKAYEESKAKAAQEDALLHFGNFETECMFPSDEVVRRLKIIEGWYEKWIDDKVWNRIRTQKPADAQKIMEAKDEIDRVFALCKKDSSSTPWQKVLDAIDAYAAAWCAVAKGFKV